MAFTGRVLSHSVGPRPNFYPSGWQQRLSPNDEAYQIQIQALNRQLALKQQELDNALQALEELQRTGMSESAKTNEQLNILQKRVNELEAKNRQRQGTTNDLFATIRTLQATVKDQGREIAIQQTKLYDSNETIQEQEKTIKQQEEENKFLKNQQTQQPQPQTIQPQPKVRIFVVSQIAMEKNPILLMNNSPEKAIQSIFCGNKILEMVVVFPGDNKSITYRDAIKFAADRSNFMEHLPKDDSSSEIIWDVRENLCAHETTDPELTQLSIETLRNFYYHTSYNTGLVVPKKGQIVAIFTKPPNPFPDYRCAPNNSGYGFPFILKEQCKHLIHTPFLIKKCHLELDEFRQPKRNRDVRMWF